MPLLLKTKKMLTRTYKEDLLVEMRNNQLRVTCTFKDINGANVDFGKSLETNKPLPPSAIDAFFEDILMEIAWRKITPLALLQDYSKPENEE